MLFWKEIPLHSSPSKRWECRSRAPAREWGADCVSVCPAEEGLLSFSTQTLSTCGKCIIWSQSKLRFMGISQLLNWNCRYNGVPSDTYQIMSNPSLRPGYRCTVNVSLGQNTNKRAVPQVVMCFSTGPVLLSSSASVTFARAALDETALAPFTPFTAGAAAL